MNVEKVILRILTLVPLSLFATSVFVPCFSIRGISPLAIFPPIAVGVQYWSFQDATRTGSYVASIDRSTGNPTVRMFRDFWFGSESNYLSFWQVWIWIFAFQILTLAFLGLSLIKVKLKGYPLPLIGAISSSGVVVICSYYMSIQISAPARGLNYTSAHPETGFLLELVSVVLLLDLLIFHFASRQRVQKQNSHHYPRFTRFLHNLL